jgi:hypothetical protein
MVTEVIEGLRFSTEIDKIANRPTIQAPVVKSGKRPGRKQ